MTLSLGKVHTTFLSLSLTHTQRTHLLNSGSVLGQHALVDALHHSEPLTHHVCIHGAEQHGWGA